MILPPSNPTNLVRPSRAEPKSEHCIFNLSTPFDRSFALALAKDAWRQSQLPPNPPTASAALQEALEAVAPVSTPSAPPGGQKP